MHFQGLQMNQNTTKQSSHVCYLYFNRFYVRIQTTHQQQSTFTNRMKTVATLTIISQPTKRKFSCFFVHEMNFYHKICPVQSNTFHLLTEIYAKLLYEQCSKLCGKGNWEKSTWSVYLLSHKQGISCYTIVKSKLIILTGSSYECDTYAKVTCFLLIVRSLTLFTNWSIFMSKPDKEALTHKAVWHNTLK